MLTLQLRTGGRVEMLDITEKVQAAVGDAGSWSGLCHVFVPHTTAGVIINENADPSVPQDIETVFARMVPDDLPYRHAEGNSPAHVKASITGPSVTIPVKNGRLLLGTWQGVFFCEFDGPRHRQVWLTFIHA